MELPVQITSHDFRMAAAAEQEIRKRAAKLDDSYDRIVRCWVVQATSQRPRTPFVTRLTYSTFVNLGRNTGTLLVSKKIGAPPRSVFHSFYKEEEYLSRHHGCPLRSLCCL